MSLVFFDLPICHILTHYCLFSSNDDGHDDEDGGASYSFSRGVYVPVARSTQRSKKRARMG